MKLEGKVTCVTAVGSGADVTCALEKGPKDFKERQGDITFHVTEGHAKAWHVGKRVTVSITPKGK